MQTPVRVPPSRPMSATVRCVAWTATVRGPSAPGAGQQPRRREAVRAPGTPRSRRAVRTGGRAAARRRRPPTRRRCRSARAARRVRSGSRRRRGREPGGVSADTRVRPGRRRAVAEPQLRPCQSLADAAGQVARVEQRDPDARVLGRRRQGRAHGVRVVVRRALRAVVEIVELPHAGDPGECHLGVDRAGQRVVGVRVEPRATSYIRLRQVQNVPRSACTRPRSARWKAWECASARPGRVSPAQPYGIRWRGYSRASPRRSAPPSTSMSTSAATWPPSQAYSAWYLIGTPAPPARRRAPTTPARQSSIAACSSGACETPVGLRTNSIAVGTCADRMPGVVPGAGRQHRNASERLDEPVAQARCGTPRPRCRTPRPARPRRRAAPRPPRRRPGSRATVARTAASSGARVSSHAGPRRDRVDAVRRDPDLAHRRDGVLAARRPSGRRAPCARTAASGRAGRRAASCPRGCPGR